MPDKTPNPPFGENLAVKIILGIVGVSVIILLIVSAYIYIPAFFSPSYKKEVSQPQMDGHFYLALQKLPIDTSQYGSVMTVNYGLVNEDLNIPRPDKPGMIEYEYRMVSTSSRPWITFVRATGLTGKIKDLNTVPFEVYRAYLHYVTYAEVNKKIHEAQQVTHDPTTVKQFPEISRLGDVLYMARPITYSGAGDIESWEVHYVPNDVSKDAVIAPGAYPKWITNSQLVYIKNDGLYTYSLDTQQEKHLWDTGAGAITNKATLGVSDDGKYIVLAAPEKNWLFVFTTVRGETLGVKLEGVVNVNSKYPLISVDNKYIAFLTSTFDPKGEEIPIVRFVDLSTLKIIPSTVVSLNGWYTKVQDDIREYLASTSPESLANFRPREGLNYDNVILTTWFQTRHPASE